MKRITIVLHEDESEALKNLAQSQRRNTRSQAAILIRKQLVLSGLVDHPERADGLDDTPFLTAKR